MDSVYRRFAANGRGSSIMTQAGHLHGDFSNRELIQKPLQNAVQRFGSHCYAVDGHDRPLVGILQLGGQLVGGITVRVSTVQQNDVGLTDGLQFGDDAALGLAVRFPAAGRPRCRRW